MHFECDGDSDFDLRQFGGRQIHNRKQLIVINDGDQGLTAPDRFKFTSQQLFHRSVERRPDSAESQLKQRICIIDLGSLVALDADFRIQFRLYHFDLALKVLFEKTLVVFPFLPGVVRVQLRLLHQGPHPLEIVIVFLVIQFQEHIALFETLAAAEVVFDDHAVDLRGKNRLPERKQDNFHRQGVIGHIGGGQNQKRQQQKQGR